MNGRGLILLQGIQTTYSKPHWQGSIKNGYWFKKAYRCTQWSLILLSIVFHMDYSSNSKFDLVNPDPTLKNSQTGKFYLKCILFNELFILELFVYFVHTIFPDFSAQKFRVHIMYENYIINYFPAICFNIFKTGCEKVSAYL